MIRKPGLFLRREDQFGGGTAPFSINALYLFLGHGCQSFVENFRQLGPVLPHSHAVDRGGFSQFSLNLQIDEELLFDEIGRRGSVARIGLRLSFGYRIQSVAGGRIFDDLCIRIVLPQIVDEEEFSFQGDFSPGELLHGAEIGPVSGGYDHVRNCGVGVGEEEKMLPVLPGSDIHNDVELFFLQLTVDFRPRPRKDG